MGSCKQGPASGQWESCLTACSTKHTPVWTGTTTRPLSSTRHGNAVWCCSFEKGLFGVECCRCSKKHGHSVIHSASLGVMYIVLGRFCQTNCCCWMCGSIQCLGQTYCPSLVLFLASLMHAGLLWLLLHAWGLVLLTMHGFSNRVGACGSCQLWEHACVAECDCVGWGEGPLLRWVFTLDLRSSTWGMLVTPELRRSGALTVTVTVTWFRASAEHPVRSQHGSWGPRNQRR